jgi:gamma-glutamyltranspeptidase
MAIRCSRADFREPAPCGHARSHRKGGRDAFYKGPIARAIVADMKKRDGLLDERDFADHKADWVEPISTSYRDYDVYEVPPNTQGSSCSRCSASSKASTSRRWDTTRPKRCTR